ncbi:ABC transporter ATP-binding protein [Roseburia hominis]
MLRLKNVKKKYDGFELNCTMEVQPGRITGLIGKNGAGKSTTFKAALGLIRPDSGEIELFGKPIQKITKTDREDIGVVLASSGFCGTLSIKDLLPVLQNLYHGFQKEEFLKRCKELELPADKLINQFSTGMRQKLHVLIAISHQARLLILDEPTAGMDVIARDELLDILRDYMESGDRSILISSHISADLEGLCDDIYMINDGEIILHEDTDALLDAYGLLKMSSEQFEKTDRRYILRYKKERFGYSCLTDQKQFYLDNYPEVVVEKSNIDEVILMMSRGEA